VARALAVLVVVALAVPATAAAHARLVRTVPADGSTLTRAPRVVLVEFDDTVRAAQGNAAVANDSRRSVLAAPARTRGRTLQLPLAPGLRVGAYTVRWSIVSEDGHKEEGLVAFAVGKGAARPVAVLSASASARPRDVALRALYYFGLLVAAGTSVFALLARPLLQARLRRPVSELLFVALLAAFLGASGLEADAASGTRFALVLELAVGVALTGAAAAALAPVYAPLLAAAGACALALVVAPALAGHALDRDQPAVVAPVVDVLHTVAAAVWVGGLVAALWILRRSSADTWERRAILRRFSSAATAAVALLALSGAGRAVTELGAASHLWSTSYGRALLAKTAIFVPLLALGRLSRSRLEQRPAAAARSIRVEIVLVAAIVAVVAVLTELRPGRESPAPLRGGAGARAGLALGAALRPDRLEEAGRVLERGQP
jgi:copper transport protein